MKGSAGTILIAVIIVAVFSFAMLQIVEINETGSSVTEITGCAVTTGSGLCLQKNLKAAGEYVRNIDDWLPGVRVQRYQPPKTDVPRPKRSGDPALAALDAAEYRSYFSQVFGEDNPLYREIAGMSDDDLLKKGDMYFMIDSMATRCCSKNPNCCTTAYNIVYGDSNIFSKNIRESELKLFCDLMGPDCFGEGFESVVIRLSPEEAERYGAPYPSAVKVSKGTREYVETSVDGVEIKALSFEKQQELMNGPAKEYAPEVYGYSDEGLIVEEIKGTKFSECMKSGCYGKSPAELEKIYDDTITDLSKKGIYIWDFHYGNLMLTPNGEVVIVDFGYAKHLPGTDPRRIENLYKQSKFYKESD